VKYSKNTATVGELITAECASVILFIFLVHISQVGWRIISKFLDEGVGVWEKKKKKFGCKLVDDNWDGLNVHSVMQVGSESASGIITDDLETFWLGSWEFEVVGGTYGAADRGGIS
jgi:hypothetical protein